MKNYGTIFYPKSLYKNVILTETYAENKCNILINTTRLHHEILKHWLSCIPIHITELELLPEKYVLESWI